jgi:methyltransferase-like protein/SAM-dependent methyltransferase
MAEETVGNTYDDVPYYSYAYPQTHPDRLNVIAHLFGMTPTPVENCRVLELGCASGGNLLPMAEALPGSTFLGIDRSGRQIDDGLKILNESGLGNIELQHCDILDFPEDTEPFDYILVHGIYSWVPEQVQKQILDICKRHLTPQGVAYVSYNIFPGWHMRGMLRDMMVYHSGQIADPALRVAEARALIDFLQGAVATQDSAYSKLLQDELKLLKRVNDSYIFHEHLEDHNEPVYFHQFNDRLKQTGLQFLGEANFHTMMARNFAENVANTLQKVSSNNIIRMEQYMDFVRNGHFRQTLMVHNSIPLKRDVGARPISDLFVSCAAVPVEGEDPSPARTGSTSYKLPNGRQFNTTKSVLKAALPIVREAWPDAISIKDLAAQVHETANPRSGDRKLSVEEVSNILSSDFVQLFSLGVAEIRPRSLGVSSGASKKPKVRDLVRLYAKTGGPLINLRHETITLNDMGRNILGLLDGKRTEKKVLTDLVGLATSSKINVQRNGEVIKDPDTLKEVLVKPVRDTVNTLANHGFLIDN